jgi:SAM-dependent methyltransferase
VSGDAGSDIFAGQPADPDLLAEMYDLEHDAISEDLVFYREMAAAARGAVLDLGCGSGRLFAAFLAGGARRVLGVDASPALLRRAQARIAADERLRAAAAAGRLELMSGDVRRFRTRRRFALVVAAGLLAHLGGTDDAPAMLAAARRALSARGRLVLDTLGPGAMPVEDLPLSLDWRRTLGRREVVRRSQLTRREAADGLHVLYSTLTDTPRPDGTIARLPASYRLWYPSPAAIARLVGEAGMAVEATYGSHDLDPLDDASERCIVIARHAGGVAGRGLSAG